MDHDAKGGDLDIPGQTSFKFTGALVSIGALVSTAEK
jgi:hypothetical protein